MVFCQISGGKHLKDWGLDIVTSVGVYPPSEDTHLLCDCISLKSSDSFLEIGCGTGYIALNAARVAKTVVASDVSMDAVVNARENSERNSLSTVCSVIQSDLLHAFRPTSRFSVIVFNPPYLPATDETSSLDTSVVGGRTGAELTERFVKQAASYLVRSGNMYVVTSSLAQPERVIQAMHDCSLRVEPVAATHVFFETISVFSGTPEKRRKETVL